MVFSSLILRRPRSFAAPLSLSEWPRTSENLARYFLACGGLISVKVSGHRWRCKQLCGRMEIPSQVTFSCSRKAMLNWLKALLMKKVWCKLMFNINKNSSFRSHQTRKSNNQCVLWYSFMKLLFCYTGLYRLQHFPWNVLIYGNLRHCVQMFSQISRIPDLIRKFWAKRCGLYAGVYGSVSIALHCTAL